MTAPDLQTTSVIRSVAKVSAVIGGPLFLIGVVLHPARDGDGIAVAGNCTE